MERYKKKFNENLYEVDDFLDWAEDGNAWRKLEIEWNKGSFYMVADKRNIPSSDEKGIYFGSDDGKTHFYIEKADIKTIKHKGAIIYIGTYSGMVIKYYF